MPESVILTQPLTLSSLSEFLHLPEDREQRLRSVISVLESERLERRGHEASLLTPESDTWRQPPRSTWVSDLGTHWRPESRTPLR